MLMQGCYMAHAAAVMLSEKLENAMTMIENNLQELIPVKCALGELIMILELEQQNAQPSDAVDTYPLQMIRTTIQMFFVENTHLGIDRSTAPSL